MSTASDELFGRLAAHYDEHFAVGHRHAYDRLSWQLTLAELPAPPATVLDVGCGVGRWAEPLLDAGYAVIGVEPSPPMADEAGRRVPAMTLVRAGVEDAELPDESADAVLAMGSLQYSPDPGRAFGRVARWLRPGGVCCILVDSRIALAVELTRGDKRSEAFTRLDTGRGEWRPDIADAATAELTLFDAAGLRAALTAAGLVVDSVRGLLIGASVWGRDELAARLDADFDAQLTVERELTDRRELADLGKQLFAVAHRPA